MLCVLFLVLLGVMAGFVFLQEDNNNDGNTQAIPGAATNVTTDAPNAFITLAPTRVPITSAPTSSPGSLPEEEGFDPPNPEDCIAGELGET
jgi:hypothetical protein